MVVFHSCRNNWKRKKRRVKKRKDLALVHESVTDDEIAKNRFQMDRYSGCKTEREREKRKRFTLQMNCINVSLDRMKE